MAMQMANTTTAATPEMTTEKVCNDVSIGDSDDDEEDDEG